MPDPHAPLARPHWLVVALVSLAAAGCATRAPAPRPSPVPGPPGAEATLVVRTPAGLVRIDLERYVEGVVAGELAVSPTARGAARSMVALQAVIARTYAVANRGRHRAEGFDLCAETHCQLYRPERVQAVAGVVRSEVAVTHGLVVTYDGRPINALYHADCGGRTSDADVIWGGTPAPYLRGVDDHTCLAPPRTWRFEAGAADLAAAMSRDPALAVGPRVDGMAVRATDEAGRVTALEVDGSTRRVIRGEALRRVVMSAFGADSIRSPRFTVTRVARGFLFEGRGVGHGAGLCQRGALARLSTGSSVADVVAQYYPGTRLAPWNATTRLTRVAEPEDTTSRSMAR